MRNATQALNGASTAATAAPVKAACQLAQPAARAPATERPRPWPSMAPNPIAASTATSKVQRCAGDKAPAPAAAAGAGWRRGGGVMGVMASPGECPGFCAGCTGQQGRSGWGWSTRSLGGRTRSAATGGDESHFVPAFRGVPTSTPLKSGRKLGSRPARFASTSSAAQAPSPEQAVKQGTRLFLIRPQRPCGQSLTAQHPLKRTCVFDG